MEILKKEQYVEYDQFIKNHSRGEFTQSALWGNVKKGWLFEAVVSRDNDGSINGACGVFIKKLPLVGTSFIYSPRGFVCDIHDEHVLDNLKLGLDMLAKKHKAHTVKIDPDIPMDDYLFINYMKSRNFKHIYGRYGFETVQPRFNYRLRIDGKNEDELFMSFSKKTRYNIRYAAKKGVRIIIKGEDGLDDFMELYRITGERDGFKTRPRDYFARLLKAMGEGARVYLGYYNDIPVCGAITTNYAGKCSYVYGASSNYYRNVMPNYLMQWEMIRWGQSTGCRIYDFLGISGDLEHEDSPMFGLYRFKRGFNGYVDELVGEFDFIYRPVINVLFNTVIRVKSAFSTRVLKG